MALYIIMALFVSGEKHVDCCRHDSALLFKDTVHQEPCGLYVKSIFVSYDIFKIQKVFV